MTSLFKRYKKAFCTMLILFSLVTVSAQDSTLLPGRPLNVLSVKYDLSFFNKNAGMASHLVSLEYQHHAKKFTLIPRINYANRFSKSGVQFETDIYPVITKKIYAYINAGYSNDVLL